MRNLIRELNSFPDIFYKFLGIIMAFDLSTLDRSTIAAIMTKYFNQSVLLIDYIPLVGPMYNATYALNLLFSIWPGKTVPDDDDDDSDSTPDEIELEKSRLVRVKGLTAVATALIDIFTLCLTVGVIAFVCDCLVRINTFAIVRQILILFILANVIALTVGSKIITGQLVEHLTRQLEEVNSVGTSMVKSVTITASAIERIVETTNSKTGAIFYKVANWWTQLVAFIVAVITFPAICAQSARSKVDRQLLKYRIQVQRIRNNCRHAIATVRYYLIPFRRVKQD